MTLQYCIENYGYIAVLVGTFLEGDMVLVLGGFVARLEYLKLPGVILAATVSTFVRCAIFFFLGRWHGKAILAKRPAWQARVGKTNRLLELYRLPVILGFRFFYGLGIITPLMLGSSRVPTAQFIVLNLLGAVLWASVVGVGGYLVGDAMRTLFGDIKRYELVAFGALAFVGVAVWLFRRRHLKSAHLHNHPSSP